ncbi:hypothetical protein BC831DRAFT_463385 [Entophlyctis helioformis]|nr:hypothetical protein BC831DRAFT_463385 [Entophlyctis helioformis]
MSQLPPIPLQDQLDQARAEAAQLRAQLQRLVFQQQNQTQQQQQPHQPPSPVTVGSSMFSLVSGILSGGSTSSTSTSSSSSPTSVSPSPSAPPLPPADAARRQPSNPLSDGMNQFRKRRSTQFLSGLGLGAALGGSSSSGPSPASGTAFSGPVNPNGSTYIVRQGTSIGSSARRLSMSSFLQGSPTHQAAGGDSDLEDTQSVVTFDDVTDELQVARQMTNRLRREVLDLNDALGSTLGFMASQIAAGMRDGDREIRDMFELVPSMGLPDASPSASNVDGNIDSNKDSDDRRLRLHEMDWHDYWPMEFVHRVWDDDSDYDSDTDRPPQERDGLGDGFAWWRFMAPSGAFEGMRNVRRKTSRGWELACLEAEIAAAEEEAEERRQLEKALKRQSQQPKTQQAQKPKSKTGSSSSLFAMEDMNESSFGDDDSLVPLGDDEQDPAELVGNANANIPGWRPSAPGKPSPLPPPKATASPNRRSMAVPEMAGAFLSQTASWLGLPSSSPNGSASAASATSPGRKYNTSNILKTSGSSEDLGLGGIGVDGAAMGGRAPALGWFEGDESIVSSKTDAAALRPHSNMRGLRWDAEDEDESAAVLDMQPLDQIARSAASSPARSSTGPPTRPASTTPAGAASTSTSSTRAWLQSIRTASNSDATAPSPRSPVLGSPKPQSQPLQQLPSSPIDRPAPATPPFTPAREPSVSQSLPPRQRRIVQEDNDSDME